MIDKLFLSVIAAFNPLFAKAGINTFQLSEIVRVKLMIDNRRPIGMFVNRKRSTGSTTSTSVKAMIFTLIFGVFYGALLFMFNKPLVAQTVYFSAFMVLMSLTLITDFTNVLIDVRDQYIIAPKPVDDRTLAMARILHISIYVLRLALIQGLPAIVMIGFIDGAAAVPLFLFQVIEATMLSIFFVNIIYLLMMKLVSPQKFKDIISYFQIAFSVLIFAAYQLLPRLISMSQLENFNLLNHPWSYILPPVWIAALNEVLIHPSRSTFTTSILAIIGFSIPFISIWFVAKVLAPGFNKRLSVIALSDGAATVPPTAKVTRSGFIDKVANWLSPDPVENAGFRITWKLAARSRDFKMKVYPQFAFIPVYFIYFTLVGRDGGESLSSRFAKLEQGKSYIFLIYMSTIVLSAILQQISQSEKYKSSWVYYALPINQPGKILAGMYKAIVALYFFPYCLILSIVSISIWGPSIVNDIILAFLIAQIYGILLALFLVKGLPFSRPVLNKQSGGRVIISLILMLFAGAIGYGHYIISKWETAVWVLIIPAGLIYWLMFRYYRKQTWDNIELSEID